MSKAHDILGISPNATEEQIKIAYRKKAKKLHPDHNKNPDAKEKFIELNNAYMELIIKKPHSFIDLINNFGELVAILNLIGQKGCDINKIKILNESYNKFLECGRELKVNTIKEIINYLERVLNNEVDVNERISKTAYFDTNIYEQFSYNIRNLFHPKFINKLPKYWQLCIHNRMREIIEYFSKELNRSEYNRKKEKKTYY